MRKSTIRRPSLDSFLRYGGTAIGCCAMLSAFGSHLSHIGAVLGFVIGLAVAVLICSVDASYRR
jgi:hypothetical protein